MESNEISYDIFYDSIGKFDNFSNFMKTKLYFSLLNKSKLQNKNLIIKKNKSEDFSCDQCKK